MTLPGAVEPTLLFRVYRVAASLLAPFAYNITARKLRRQGIAPIRLHERLGHATKPRALGPLIWFHAASVGESLSVLTLITRMAEQLPETHFLITSGTATSAKLIADRMPPRTQHQFAPLDAAGPVRRFLKHWRPDAGIFIESELWPLMLVRARASGARLALLNARLSENSVKRWKKRAETARFVLDQFDIILTQNDKTAENLVSIGADPDRVQPGTNLKSTSAALPVNDIAQANLQNALGGRPVWVASSTHPGEEDIVLAAHRSLLNDHPNLCLILVPRHPERGNTVATLIAERGLTYARRTKGTAPDADTQVYLADTLGELGTWYATSGIVFLGGSLLPIGGHNPFEPAQAGTAILTGPHVTNFAETFDPMFDLGGVVCVQDASDLAQAVGRWLQAPDQLATAQSHNQSFIEAQKSGLDDVVKTLCTSLGLEAEND